MFAIQLITVYQSVLWQPCLDDNRKRTAKAELVMNFPFEILLRVAVIGNIIFIKERRVKLSLATTRRRILAAFRLRLKVATIIPPTHTLRVNSTKQIIQIITIPTSN